MTLYSIVYCTILVTSFGYDISSHFFILYICIIISSFLYWVPWEDSPPDYMGSRNHYCIMFVCCKINLLTLLTYNITVSCKLFNVNRDAICSIKISNLCETRVTRSDTSSLMNIKYKNLVIPRSLHTISK